MVPVRLQILVGLLALVGACSSSAPKPAPIYYGLRPVEAPATVSSQASGPVDGVPAVPDLSGSPDLSLLLRSALARNPKIRAARERAAAAAEDPAITGWLANPVLTVGWYETPVETRVGPQEWVLGLRQPIPFPTKLSTRAELSETEARRAVVVYERIVRDVLTEVVTSSWEIGYLDEATVISAAIGRVLERYVVAAAAEEDTGSPVRELFRAETQRAQLESDRVMLIELRAAEAERLRALLSLPPRAEVGTPRTGIVPPVRADREEMLRILADQSQELKEAGLTLEAASLRTSLAEQRRIPDLTLGVTRIFTGDVMTSGPQPIDSGKDAVILTAGVTIPLWIGKDDAAIRKARAMQRAAALDRLDAAQSARQRLARAWFRLGNAERLDRLYHEVLVPRAEVATSTAEDLMAAGKGTLGGTLETVAVLHNFRLAAARARADHGQALARLEAVLGRPFTRTETGEASR